MLIFMKIIDTFAIVEEHLYSVQYDNQEVDEWQRLFNLWLKDTDYLRSFFEEHKDDLFYGHYKGITIDEAILKTQKEAKKMKQNILNYAKECGQGLDTFSLNTLFKPLDNKDFSNSSYERDKSKRSWLRIYAIRVESNLFVVSGGTIKLTKKMDRPHLEKELEKLELTRNFLIDRDDDLETFELF